MAKKDPQDPGPVPEEKRTVRPAVTLPEELSAYVKEIASATGCGQRALLNRISTSKEFAQAVRQVCSAQVDDHVRDVQARIGFKLNLETAAPPASPATPEP